MANEVIQTGDKIEIKPVKGRSMEEAIADTTYVSQFLEWVSTSIVLIAAPIYQGHILAMRAREVYDFCFYTKGGLYRCRGTVTKRMRRDDNVAAVEIKFISPLEKFQRRQFYRMSCIVPLEFAVVSPGQLELYKNYKACKDKAEKEKIRSKIAAEDIRFYKGTVLDISGGGMRFNSEITNELNTDLVLMPVMPGDSQKIFSLFFGRVISSTKIPHKEPAMYDNRIEFIHISPAEQESIITYIFREEREKRKRALDSR